ncbi:MAG: hypothetical protein AAF264_05640 [Pseudomonadota bacterium]
MSRDFNVAILAQRGRLAFEAVLFAATLRHHAPRWAGRLIVAEPRPGPLWTGTPGLPELPHRAILKTLEAEIRPFDSRHFGETYPPGNKIEALAVLPPGPFVFFDTDSVITNELADLPIDFDRPAASMKREGTWPKLDLYGSNYNDIWGVLHARQGGDVRDTLDRGWPDNHWRRYLYFNAGWFFGADPQAFHHAYLNAALMIRDDPPPEIAGQILDPWLDQAALPLAIHALGGGRPGDQGGIADGLLDESHSVHYRFLPLLYATASDDVIRKVECAARLPEIEAVLRDYEPFRQFLYEGKGAAARALFDRTALPRKEQPIRQKLRQAGLWVR